MVYNFAEEGQTPNPTLMASVSLPVLTDKCKRYKENIVKLTNHIKQ
jgi:hypothetical protein